MVGMCQKLAFGAFMGWNFELSQGDLERWEGGHGRLGEVINTAFGMEMRVEKSQQCREEK